MYGLRGRAASRSGCAGRWTSCGWPTAQRDRVAEYSGGMKRRLNIAAALVHEPSVSCSTNPPSASIRSRATPSSTASKRSGREGRTVVYTTHYMEEAARLCDRVGIIDHGRLLALDTVPTAWSPTTAVPPCSWCIRDGRRGARRDRRTRWPR